MIVCPGSSWRPCAVMLGFAAFFGLDTAPANAEDFAIAVSPPRFELSAKAGETIRAVAELSNRSDAPTGLTFATAEWDLSSDGGVVLSETLRPGSCRPWVAIERREVLLPGRSQLRYRFEVSPPADAPASECRFAIVISGGDEQISPSENVNVPVRGQIALIVYVALGGVKPELQIIDADVVDLGGVMTPVLMVENTGAAHGRLSAFLSGVDAAGVKREFSPSTLPVLPGETRMIALNQDIRSDAIETDLADQRSPQEVKPIVYPLTVQGTITDTVKSIKFEGVFER